MKISIITLFPDMFAGPFAMSMLKKAQDKGLVEIELVDLRKFGIGPRRQVDDTPYGGGDGMVLRPEPVVGAIEAVKENGERRTKNENNQTPNSELQTPKVILLTPQGSSYTQATARALSTEDHLILVCGHYEGFDERIRQFADLQISIGDYVLTGGELPAMVLADSIARLIPGVLGGEESLKDESFNDGSTLEYPQYTRPAEFCSMKVPEVLLSGHHAEVARWRQAHTKRSQQNSA